jgi:hypothetical protein
MHMRFTWLAYTVLPIGDLPPGAYDIVKVPTYGR